MSEDSKMSCLSTIIQYCVLLAGMALCMIATVIVAALVEML